MVNVHGTTTTSTSTSSTTRRRREGELGEHHVGSVDDHVVGVLVRAMDTAHAEAAFWWDQLSAERSTYHDSRSI